MTGNSYLDFGSEFKHFDFIKDYPAPLLGSPSLNGMRMDDGHSWPFQVLGLAHRRFTVSTGQLSQEALVLTTWS